MQAAIMSAVRNELERQQRAGIQYDSLPTGALVSIIAQINAHIEQCKAVLALRGQPTPQSYPEHNGKLLVDALAVDCEMIETESQKHALARCCLVSWDECCVLDAYVAPGAPVVDYLTRFSGIRAHDLVGAPPFEVVQARVAAMIEGRVLIGHGLHNDLRALSLRHPAELTVDTAELDWGEGRAINLKALSLDVLGLTIQRGGHSPHEDALASLLLLKAYREHGGPPPPRPVSFWVRSLETPSLPGCHVEAAEGMPRRGCHVEAAEGATGEGDGSTGTRGCDTMTARCDALPLWHVTLPWSQATVRTLLEWYAESALADTDGCAATPLCFAPCLGKSHRELLHREAGRMRLATASAGIGEARALRVLPRGVTAPQPSEEVQRLASLVYRWAREAAEQQTESEAAPPPFSLGEVTEIVAGARCEGATDERDERDERADEVEDTVPVALAPLFRRARGVLRTVPRPKVGEAMALRARGDYERCLAVKGRLDAARHAVGGKAVAEGRKDRRGKHKQRR